MAEGNGSGAKAFGGMAILAVVGTMTGVVTAVVRPMNQRIAALEKQIHSHIGIKDHPLVQTEGIRHNREAITAIQGQMHTDDQREQVDARRMGEIEVELRALREISDVRAEQEITGISELRKWAAAHDLRVVALNAAQWERIRSLERKVFGSTIPIEQGPDTGGGP